MAKTPLRHPRDKHGGVLAASSGHKKCAINRAPVHRIRYAPKIHTHFLDATANRIQAEDTWFNKLKGGDPMSNGLLTPFAIAKVSISIEGRVARQEEPDTSGGLSA